MDKSQTRRPRATAFPHFPPSKTSRAASVDVAPSLLGEQEADKGCKTAFRGEAAWLLVEPKGLGCGYSNTSKLLGYQGELTLSGDTGTCRPGFCVVLAQVFLALRFNVSYLLRTLVLPLRFGCTPFSEEPAIQEEGGSQQWGINLGWVRQALHLRQRSFGSSKAFRSSIFTAAWCRGL